MQPVSAMHGDGMWMGGAESGLVTAVCEDNNESATSLVVGIARIATGLLDGAVTWSGCPLS